MRLWLLHQRRLLGLHQLDAPEKLHAGQRQCWGQNVNGQIGDGTTADRRFPATVAGLASDVTAIALGGYHTCARTAAGALTCWGSNNAGQIGDGSIGTSRFFPTVVSGLSTGVAGVGAGERHTCAVSTAGAMKCWGFNFAGQLGDGTVNDRPSPVPVVSFL